MRQFHLGRHARKFGARHSRRRLPVLKLGLAAAVVVALAGIWLFVPFGRPDPASSQAPESSSVPSVERTDGTTRSNPRLPLPVGRPLSTPSLLPPAATVTPGAPTWAAPPGTTGPTTTDPGTTAPSTTGPTTAGPTTTGTTTTGPTTTRPTAPTGSPTTKSPTTTPPPATASTNPTTSTPTTSTPTTSTPSTPSTPSTTPTDTPTYKDCAEVRAAGKAPLYRGDPGYTPELDRNGDGIACERGNS